MFKDKVVVIIGAGKGLGRFLCRKFSENGATLAMFYYNSENGAKAVHDHLKTHNINSIYKKCDVTNIESINEALKYTVDEFSKIDIIINCANIFYDKNILEIDTEILNRIIDVNFKGVLNVTNSVLPYFKNQNFGHLINISSVHNYNIVNENIKKVTKESAKILQEYNSTCNMVENGPIDNIHELMNTNSWSFDRKIQKISVDTISKFVIMLVNENINGQIITVDNNINL